MTVLTPCRRCHRRDDCAIRRETLARLRGLNITKANLRCGLIEQDFPIGARVTVKAFELSEDPYGDFGKVATVRRGTITRWRPHKATVVLDKDQEIEQPSAAPIGYLHAEPDRLARIDEPVVEMCACGWLTRARCESRIYPSIRHGSDWLCPEREADRWNS